MTDPTIAGRAPKKTKLEAGEEYHWCACGRSQNQPFCDGSHAGTEFSPIGFKATDTGDAHLCMCKRTKNPPYCDGSHKDLPKETDPSNQSVVNVDRSNTALAPSNTTEEPHVEFIHAVARDGLDTFGHHGPMGAMGVPRSELPHWDDIQILPAQMARKPLLEDRPVGTELIIGPNAQRPLRLEIPLFVSDMSFGALSQEAKLALAKGAELAGTGICSGEGGMLPEEQAANNRYFYELASAKFGYEEKLMTKIQAFHFKGGQGAKTGTGGHLPGTKVTAKIAEVRGLSEGMAAVSPPTFADLTTVDDFRKMADRIRSISDGIPIGFKLSANHIEDDIDFALAASADYIILDGRGGGTGAAPLLFRDHISVPTLAALARARRHLDNKGNSDVTLIITGGLRVPADFIKALCLGADGIALSNTALQAIGCVGARMCNTNLCPAGIATQKEELRQRIDVELNAQRLQRVLTGFTELMQVMARACGHDHFNKFNPSDITTWKKDIAELTGIKFAGVGMLE